MDIVTLGTIGVFVSAVAFGALTGLRMDRLADSFASKIYKDKTIATVVPADEATAPAARRTNDVS